MSLTRFEQENKVVQTLKTPGSQRSSRILLGKIPQRIPSAIIKTSYNNFRNLAWQITVKIYVSLYLAATQMFCIFVLFANDVVHPIGDCIWKTFQQWLRWMSYMYDSFHQSLNNLTFMRTPNQCCYFLCLMWKWVISHSWVTQKRNLEKRKQRQHPLTLKYQNNMDKVK